ncbi:hypothetical protein F3Y22_tig00013386pilonHSYRG00118 [Hibiscus syriacus]|uniref:Uncharacterized protein n=1 Tax=Hibiscus syriacus TaxID=106335 RepID=A0A6A3C1V4_HIBSY|nr:hypothetical protein F3Y22_tig00013386pilonHSYRG00118 [Hibiscus syriacus]
MRTIPVSIRLDMNISGCKDPHIQPQLLLRNQTEGRGHCNWNICTTHSSAASDRWKPPNPGIIKINVDVAFDPLRRLAVVGVIALNELELFWGRLDVWKQLIFSWGIFLLDFSCLLLIAALSNWSLISLVDLIAFLLIQYTAPKIGYKQSVGEAWWMKLIGFMIIQSWKSPFVVYFLVVQLLAGFVALLEIRDNRFGLVPWQYSCWSRFLTAIERLGYFSTSLLPSGLELAVGISHPSWISLLFSVGSCVGLVNWSLTSNFLGLFRFWRVLQLYAGFIIVLLYLHQLPLEFSNMLQRIAEFFVQLSYVKYDLEEMGVIMSMLESNLTEQPLPSKHSFFIRESRQFSGLSPSTFSLMVFQYDHNLLLDVAELS